MAVVGIDLGTTNTVIAAVRDGRATALKDKLGRPLLPSVVSFSPTGAPKVGYPAKDRRTIDPENTVFSIKRLIGRTFDSEHVQKAIKRLPFDIKEGPGKSTLIGAYGKDHTLPEISAMVLQEAAEIAQARLGCEIADAVITVPANFNDLQRAATKVAGRTAGLEVLRIINEPTAAALAYGFGKTGRERIAVYDFGGGTFDVTLLDLSENVFEVLATAGDTFLGGDDLDREIMDRMAEELLKKQKIDASKDNLVREQLRAAAEKLKIDLSTRSMGKVRIEALEFDFTLRRSEFEKLAEPLLARTLQVCQEALDVAGVAKKDLDQILLVGGSTRIPLVRRRISSFFGKMPQSRINPDEVVAIGAAIQAASLEAKQGQTSIPHAPRPRAQAVTAQALISQSSRAPADLKTQNPGTTKTGLAGLKKTLTGPGPSDAPARTTETSVLAGLKSVPPIVNSPGPRIGPAQTLPGTGPGRASSPPLKLGQVQKPSLTGTGREKMNTLAGVGGEMPADPRPNTLAGLNERARGTTNLGLGASPSSPPPNAPAALRSSPPAGPSLVPEQPAAAAKAHDLSKTQPFGNPKPLGNTQTRPGIQSTPDAASGLDFDDVTAVQKSPDLEAAARDKLETIPGVAAPADDQRMFPSSPSSHPPAMGDGSVTFDLADLEASEDVLEDSQNEFADLDDETTQLLDPKLVAANAAALEHAADEYVDLPSRSQRIEELGDSALFSMEEIGVDEEKTEVDLPMPVADLPARVSRSPQELGASALIDLDHDALEHDELDLDELDRNELHRDDHNRDLPIAAASLPALPQLDARGGASQQTAGGRSGGTQVGLPSPLAASLPSALGAGLPSALGAGLPSALGAALPSALGAALPRSAQLPASSDLMDDDELDLPLVGADPPVRLDFEAARKASPSVQDLDELSVAALLPDDESGAYPLNLDDASVIGAGAPAAAPLQGYLVPEHPGTPERSPAQQKIPVQQKVAAPPKRDETYVPAVVASPLLLDVTPLSLGVEVVGGYVDRLIERNSPIPCDRTRTFATAQDNQSVVRVRVSQGEEDQFSRNTILGEVELTGISQGPRGSVKVDVSFSLDESGMLQVSARDQATGHAANARLMLAGVAPS